MLETAQPLCIVLLGSGESEPESFAFCINRPLIDIAPAVWRLRDVDGIDSLVCASSCLDDNLDDQTIIELLFSNFDDMPAVYGRIAYALAYELGDAYEDVYLFRPIKTDDPNTDMLSSMTLPDYTLKFPTTLKISDGQEAPEWAVMLELEQSLRSA